MSDNATIVVNVMGTFSEKNRPNNGLERIARYLNENRLSHIPIVAEIGFHKNSETLDGHVLTIKLLATEPGVEPDGSDPHGYGKQIRDLLDQIRKQAGKSSFEETLFSMPRDGDGFDFDGAEEDKPAEEMDGQAELRLGPDGPREVPPASAEELMAGRAEAQAAEAEAETAPAEVEKPAAAKRSRKSATADPFTPDGGDAE